MGRAASFNPARDNDIEVIPSVSPPNDYFIPGVFSPVKQFDNIIQVCPVNIPKKWEILQKKYQIGLIIPFLFKIIFFKKILLTVFQFNLACTTAAGNNPLRDKIRSLMLNDEPVEISA
jgi:hypothetical protein